MPVIHELETMIVEVATNIYVFPLGRRLSDRVIIGLAPWYACTAAGLRAPISLSSIISTRSERNLYQVQLNATAPMREVRCPV
jgi:hypothetical protein